MHIESTSSSNRSIFVGFFSFLWQFLFHHPDICVDFGSSVHPQKVPLGASIPQRVPNPETQRTFGWPSHCCEPFELQGCSKDDPSWANNEVWPSGWDGWCNCWWLQKSSWGWEVVYLPFTGFQKASQVVQDFWTINRITKHLWWILSDLVLLNFGCWFKFEYCNDVFSQPMIFVGGCWPWDHIERVHSQKHVHSQ